MRDTEWVPVTWQGSTAAVPLEMNIPLHHSSPSNTQAVSPFSSVLMLKPFKIVGAIKLPFRPPTELTHYLRTTRPAPDPRLLLPARSLSSFHL